jgi:hypothetical protein
MIVHHIEMDDISTRIIHGPDLFTELRKIGS